MISKPKFPYRPKGLFYEKNRIVWYVDPDLMCPKCTYGVRANIESEICGECYNSLTGMRHITTDEVIFDIDNREDHGKACFIQTGINLVNAGYNVEIWYAEGQKQPHIHVKNIKGLLGLPKEVLKKYKQLFTEKYIPKEFWNDKIPDSSLYLSSSLIAEENKPHKKYKTPKLLINEFNNLFKEYDLLIGPTAPTVAFKLGENTTDPIKM
jgi:hypothetical protein